MLLPQDKFLFSLFIEGSYSFQLFPLLYPYHYQFWSLFLAPKEHFRSQIFKTDNMEVAVKMMVEREADMDRG
jgi:hypothetical protein